MSSAKALSWDWMESSVVESKLIEKTREIAVELGACPVSPATGQALRMLVASSQAKTVFEVGTGAGVSGLYLLEALGSDGLLTTIDSEAIFQAKARQAFRQAGSSKARVINGRALEVLPRMAKAAYDLVVIDADEQELSAYLSQAKRMLRPGGIVAIVHALWFDQVGDPAKRDSSTVAVRSAIRQLAEDEDFLTNLLTVGDGLAVGVLR